MEIQVGNKCSTNLFFVDVQVIVAVDKCDISSMICELTEKYLEKTLTFLKTRNTQENPQLFTKEIKNY